MSGGRPLDELSARQACNLSYVALTEGLDDEHRKDVDYVLAAEPGAPPTRQKGTRELMGILGVRKA